MSSNNFRDSTVVIIETGRSTVRAGQGLHDLLRLPTVVRPLRFNSASVTGLKSGLCRTYPPELALGELLRFPMTSCVGNLLPHLSE